MVDAMRSVFVCSCVSCVSVRERERERERERDGEKGGLIRSQNFDPGSDPVPGDLDLTSKSL